MDDTKIQEALGKLKSLTDAEHKMATAETRNAAIAGMSNISAFISCLA